jgi:hypothetical protein
LDPKTSAGKGQHKIKSIQSHNGLYVCWWIEGPDIRRVGVFIRPDKKWYTQDLRQPVDKAIPITDRTLVVYPLGRFVYAFSVLTKSWEILTLPEGASATPKIRYVSPAENGNEPAHLKTNEPIEEAVIEHNGTLRLALKPLDCHNFRKRTLQLRPPEISWTSLMREVRCPKCSFILVHIMVLAAAGCAGERESKPPDAAPSKSGVVGANVGAPSSPLGLSKKQERGR